MNKYKLLYTVILLISAMIISSSSVFAADTNNAESMSDNQSSTVYYEPGDVDGNGIVNINDVTVFQLTLIGKLSQTAKKKKNAETYTDQLKNIRDVTAIQMYLARIYRQLPVTPDGYYAEIFRP